MYPQNPPCPRRELSRKRYADRPRHVPRRELVARTYVEHVGILPQKLLHFSRRKSRKRRQFGQRRRTRAIDLGVFQEIFGTSRKVGGQLRDELFPARNLQRVVRKALGPYRRRPLRPHRAPAQRPRPVRGIHHHRIRQREQFLVQTVVKQSRKFPRRVRARKIRASNITNKQRIASQHCRGLL